MQLNEITKRTKTSSKQSRRVGRGGRRGKTSGRGHKGQRSRAGHKIRPEVRDLIKKLPKLRGHGKNRARTVRSLRREFAVVNLAALEAAYSAGDKISPASLLAKDLVRRSRGKVPAVKILGVAPVGGLTKAFIIEQCAISSAARTAIEAAGGSVAVISRAAK